MITFILYEPPISKARPRVLGNGITYDPKKKEKEHVKAKMLQFVERSYMEEKRLLQICRIATSKSFHVSFDFYMKSSSIKSNLQLWNIEPHISKPDLDNLIKFYLDCGNGIFWSDDSQVNSISSKKYYSEKPRVVMRIMKNDREIDHVLDEYKIEVLKVFKPSEFKEIIDDFKKIKEMDDEIFHGFLGMDNEIPSRTALEFIIEFSLKHADKLKKISRNLRG